MTTLNNSWQEITRGSFNTGYGIFSVILIACCSEDVSGNYSTVSTMAEWELTNGSISFDSWHVGLDTTGTSGGYTNLGACSPQGLVQSSWTVAHNEDGTGTASVGISWDCTYGLTSWSDRQTVDLPTIPRKSNVSLSASSVVLDGHSSVTIYTNRKSSSFRHALYQNISGSWVQIAGGVGDNYTWIPSTNFYANIRNNSKTYQILCKTWAGSTHIGDSQVNFTLASAGVHQCSLNTGSITLNGSNSVRIYTNRNSGSFTHSVEQNFSGSMAAISNGYNVTDYIDWTPPASYYTTIGGGSKSFTIRVHCKNNNGTYLGYTDVGFTIYSAGADSVSLDNTNMTMGTAYTVSIAKRVSSFRHTVTWAFRSASDTLGTAKAVDTSVDWKPSKDLSAEIRTAMTGQGTVTCQTYYEDTPIGSTSVAFNLSVPSYNVVLGTPTITEEGTDAKSPANNLTTYGIGDTEILAIMSIKRLIVSATTSYNATIKTISVSFGGSTKTVSSGSFDDTFSGMMNGNLTITATDSRGIALASTYSRSYTFRDYFKPSVTSFNGDREPQTGDTGTLNAAGTFWNKTAGTTANVLTGAISISATGATTITPSGGNNWTTAFAVSGVDYQNSYNFKIIVTDSFGFTAEKTYTLNASEPVLVKLKHTVRIYRNLVVSNIVKATKGYFTGDLKVGGKINASGNITAPTFVGNLSGNATNATKADFLSGFISKTSNQGWGQQAGSFVTGFDAANGGDIAFRRDCPSTGQLSVIIDGRFYQNEGQYRCLDTSDILNTIYPVGSIYLQIGTTTSPASLFGGTWASLAGDWRMLLAGPASSGNGWTGGSLTTSSTSLRISQLPSSVWHCSGDQSGGLKVLFDPGSCYGINTNGDNMGQGHTHGLSWQPFIAITAWRRTA